MCQYPYSVKNRYLMRLTCTLFNWFSYTILYHHFIIQCPYSMSPYSLQSLHFYLTCLSLGGALASWTGDCSPEELDSTAWELPPYTANRKFNINFRFFISSDYGRAWCMRSSQKEFKIFYSESAQKKLQECYLINF